jgi:hypothetical protein
MSRYTRYELALDTLISDNKKRVEESVGKKALGYCNQLGIVRIYIEAFYKYSYLCVPGCETGAGARLVCSTLTYF